MLITVLRFFDPLLHPINVIWLLNLVGAAFLCWRRKWLAALLPAATVVVISLIGSTLSLRLLGTLEKPYLRNGVADVPVCDAVVLLGGGHGPSIHDPNRFDVNDAGDRILTAQELIRQGKAKTLVIGGGGYMVGDEAHSDGELLVKWIWNWKVPPRPLFVLTISRDTHDEALKVRALANEQRWKRVILVTSAEHMQRAEGVFNQAGVPIVPVACDFHAFGAKRGKPRFTPWPNPEGFNQLAHYLHETVGWWVYRLRGWVVVSPPATDGSAP